MQRIFVAGHRGMVGSALVRLLQAAGYSDLILASSNELDLRQQESVHHFFRTHRPQYVFIAAGTVGGIEANRRYPADFLYDNLMIQANIIHEAWRAGVEKLLTLGSSCIYPKHAPQPIPEDALLTGPLEPTNEYYAIAKIAGIKLAEAYRAQRGCNFIAAMPTNLYGPGDNYDLASAHVLPALIRRFHEARLSSSPQVVLWGSGQARREFLHVDDLAAACLNLMLHYNEPEIVNIGCGVDMSILELAELIREVVAYDGCIEWDRSKPDGTPRKLLDIRRISSLGWTPTISLKAGIESVYEDYCLNSSRMRGNSVGSSLAR